MSLTPALIAGFFLPAGNKFNSAPSFWESWWNTAPKAWIQCVKSGLYPQEKGNVNDDMLSTKARAIKYENIGNSDVLTYTLPGWRQSNGELWKVNTFAYVKDDFVGENGDNRKIIQGITYSLNRSGSTVQLSLCSDEKFQLFLKPKL